MRVKDQEHQDGLRRAERQLLRKMMEADHEALHKQQVTNLEDLSTQRAKYLNVQINQRAKDHDRLQKRAEDERE